MIQYLSKLVIFGGLNLGFFPFALASDAPSCGSSLSQSPSQFVSLDSLSPLNYDIQTVETWIKSFKSKIIKNLYSDNGIYSQELKKTGNISVQRRQELAFGVQVRPLAKNSSIYLAVFWSENNLNMAQMRTELFAYGGGDSTKGKIPNGSELFYHISCEACRGLNLTGEAYKGFLDKSKQDGVTLFPEESVLYNGVIKPLLAIHPDGGFNIISINAKAPALDTIIHEGHHALFDTNEDYRATLLNYWNKNIKGSSEEDAVKKAFKNGYPTEELLIDEFFAHLLQPPTFGQNNPIEKFQEDHLKNVIKLLKERNLTPPFYEE